MCRLPVAPFPGVVVNSFCAFLGLQNSLELMYINFVDQAGIVMTTQASTDSLAGRRFVLAPNIAPNWPQTVRIFIGLSAVCLGIGVVCAAYGLWPILTFAGLEVLALGAALYVSARRSLDREVINVTDNNIRIEKGRGRVEQAYEMERAWTQVELRRLSRRWDETQLVLRSRDREVTLGSFLDPDERLSLARELKGCIGPMARCGGTLFRTLGEKAG